METTIIVADDHAVFRQGLRALLERAGFSVVAEAEDGREAVDLARERRPDVVLLDVSMPKLNGMEATRQICAEVAGTRVLGLSMHTDRRYVIAMLRAGALGYVVKDSAFEELKFAIETVAKGGTFLSPLVTGVVVRDFVERAQGLKNAGEEALSPREREVLQLVAEGRQNREIAAELHISVKTVESHRAHISRKLGLFTTAALTKYAVREGLTSP